MVAILPSLIAYAAFAAAGAAAGSPARRAVDQLDEAATAEAQQRDETATRAFSDVQIKTSDGRCLFVDKLSGDFRENLTPIQVGTCGATDGQGWDVITSGKHNNVANSMLVVSTLTQACFNFDPRRAAGNQVLLFSCGGRADGGGEVTTSQLFTFNGGAGPLSFQPENESGSCFTVKGDVLDIAPCDSSDPNQSFTFGDGGVSDSGDGGNDDSSDSGSGSGSITISSNGGGQVTASATADAVATCSAGGRRLRKNKSKCTQRTRTITIPGSATTISTVTAIVTSTSAGSDDDAGSVVAAATSAVEPSAVTGNPTTPVPVSRAGGTLDPTAAAEANRRDDTATRAFSSVEIRAPNGQCLFVDPTAGDFRQNLIPVGLVDCGGTPNEKWDVITAGVHNNKPDSALIVSSLVQGCISFDGRREADDTVTLFSCGGRADGSGETNASQLMPFIGALSFPFAPESENNQTCILPGDAGRLVSGPCPDTIGPQLFSIFPN